MVPCGINFPVSHGWVLGTGTRHAQTTQHEKIEHVSKTLAASIENVPVTTDGIEVNENSLIFNPADWIELSGIVKNLKNHKSPGLDELTAKILKVSLNVEKQLKN